MSSERGGRDVSARAPFVSPEGQVTHVTPHNKVESVTTVERAAGAGVGGPELVQIHENLWIPDLCYESMRPQTERIRWRNPPSCPFSYSTFRGVN